MSATHAEQSDNEEIMAPRENMENEEVKDGGWGWVCVVAAFFVHVLVVGLERLFGMMYPDILDRFDNQATAVAGVGGVCSALRLGLGPLASLLSNRLSPRKVVMAGGLIMFAGMLATAFPPSISFLYFSWGGLVGFGGAMLYTPTLIVLSSYFRRRLPIANGIATSGSGVGSVIFPPLYAMLTGMFDFSSAVMIVAAIGLNTINCGALYRPAKKFSGLYVEERRMLEEPALTTNEERTKQNHNDDNDDETEVNGIEVNEIHEMILEDEKDSAPKKRSKKRGLDFRLFINVRFDLYLLSVGLMTMACVPLMTFLPARMLETGISVSDAAFVMSILGIPDTVSRLSAGAMYSTVPWLTKHRRKLLILYQLGIAVTLAILPSIESLAGFYIITVVYGFFMGSTIALTVTLLADWVRHTDPDRDTASGLGFMTFSRGLGIVLGPIVGGLLRDLYGHYEYTFYFLSAMMYLATSVYLILLVVDHFMTKRTKNEVKFSS